MVLMHENSGLDAQCPQMDTLQCLLNLVVWQGSQVLEHAKAFVRTVNTASLNLTAEEVGPIVYSMYFQ